MCNVCHTFVPSLSSLVDGFSSQVSQVNWVGSQFGCLKSIVHLENLITISNLNLRIHAWSLQNTWSPWNIWDELMLHRESWSRDLSTKLLISWMKKITVKSPVKKIKEKIRTFFFCKIRAILIYKKIRTIRTNKK